MSHQTPQKEVQSIRFCTETAYKGKLDSNGRMTGPGIYRFPSGIEYRGYFRDGKFHGRGMITDKTNFRFCGYFINGKCSNYHIFFPDGLEFEEEDWAYCTNNDRRFWIEINEGIQPVGETYLTNDKPSRAIPRGCYDNEEGFFDTKSGYIVDANTGVKIRYVNPDERKDIMDHCRMNEIDFDIKSKFMKQEKDWDMSTDSWVSEDCE